jgi:NAD+ diphosphatase
MTARPAHTAPRSAPAPRRRSHRGPRRIEFPCAVCGRPVTRTTGGKPRKILCPKCGYRIYDYPRVCAGLVVLKGDTTLVLRRAEPPRLGCLDTPGGFVEAGETLEGAARRECLEETGLELGRVHWLGFYWDEYELQGFGRFPTMNFYFIGRWKSGTPQAGDDAGSLEWMPLSRLGGRNERFAWKHMRDLLRDVRKWAAMHR